MRFLDFNYAIQDNVTLTPSSQKANFPVANLKSNHRNKVFRTDGTFVITTSNQKIDFREVALGPELTATIPVGTYTVAGLTAAAASALDTASANARTYTVSYSLLTGRWTITGQTYLELLFGTGTNVLNSIGPSIGYTAADLTGAITYEAGARAIHTEESIVIDLNTTEKVDSFIFFPNPLEQQFPDGIRISQDAEIRLQANATDTWDAPAVDILLSFDDQFAVATHFFSTSQEYRYWRFKIVDPRNQYLFIEIGNIVLANATQLTDPVANGFSFGQIDTSTRVRNNFGNEYVDQQIVLKSLGVNYQAMLYDDIVTLDRMFKRNGVHTPVTVVLDPDDVCFDKDHFLIYSKFQNNFEQTHLNFNLFNQDLTFQEIL